MTVFSQLGALLFGLWVIAPMATAQETPEAIADAFHEAIAFGDATAVERLLAADVKILESGHAQTSRDEYMDGHMKSDMAFIPYMTRELLDRETHRDGSLAWVVSFSRMHGSYNGKNYDFTTREMLLMQQTGDSWQITLVDWAKK